MLNTKLEVKIVSVLEHGSCNCCSQGKIIDGSKTLVFPYKEVAQVSGKGQSMNFCKDCFELLTGMKYESLQRDLL